MQKIVDNQLFIMYNEYGHEEQLFITCYYMSKETKQ